MRTIRRFQSQLLLRRSYKPGRRLPVTFRPAQTAFQPSIRIGRQTDRPKDGAERLPLNLQPQSN